MATQVIIFKIIKIMLIKSIYIFQIWQLGFAIFKNIKIFKILGFLQLKKKNYSQFKTHIFFTTIQVIMAIHVDY